jgi:hypothetical protein
MSDNQADAPQSRKDQLGSEVKESIAHLLRVVKAEDGHVKQFDKYISENDLRGSESFRDFIDSWGRFFEKIIVVDGVIFGASLTLLGFILNFSPQHHIPIKHGIYLLISWVFLLISFCSSGFQVKHVVAQKSRRFTIELLRKFFPAIAEITKCAVGILKAMENQQDPGETGNRAISEAIEQNPSLKLFLDDKQISALQTKMAFPTYPPVRLAILGWGPPLLSIALIVVFVSVSIIAW